MKSLLGLVTLALAILVVEERTRELAGDARDAIGQAACRAQEGTQTLSETVRRNPTLSLLTAGGLAYAFASILPRHT